MSSRPVVFLDFDDVLCLNEPYGGYDAKQELANEAKGLPSNEKLWTKLFNSDAKEHLREVYSAWKPSYVISSTWGLLFDKPEISKILDRCGLDFVTINLHDDWSTPKQSIQGRRSAEIGEWLRKHPEARQSWVVLDDDFSGKDLLRSTLDLSFVVLCQESTGLQQAEAEKMHKALQKRYEQAALGS